MISSVATSFNSWNKINPPYPGLQPEIQMLMLKRADKPEMIFSCHEF
jgi:hypothetical protein